MGHFKTPKKPPNLPQKLRKRRRLSSALCRFLDVDWEFVSDDDFRDLLAALKFEASYEPRKRELTIRVTLVPELTSPDGDRAPLLSVPQGGNAYEGRSNHTVVSVSALYSL
jgi:hypothetical protein